MTRRVAVIDTNVIVSALLTSRPESAPAQILRAMVTARFPFLVSVALLAEYRQVLLRQPMREKHQLDDNGVDKILTDIALNGIVVEPPPASFSAPDAGDQHLWDLLAERPGAVLVTGDAKLLQSPPTGASVVSPSGFVELRNGPSR